jgi:serine O-acetyltransferase
VSTTRPGDGFSEREVGERSVPANPPFWVGVRADLAEMAKVKATPYPSIGGLVDVLTLPGTWAVILWRLANLLHERKLRPLSRMVYFLNVVVFGAELQPGSVIGAGMVMPHPVGIGIATETVFGERVRLMRSLAIGGSGDPKRPGHPHIGDDVWIMDGGKVFGPVTVGDRTILGTNAIISQDVPADMFVYGARRSDAMRPLAELGLEDHGGSLPAVTIADAAAQSGPRLARAVGDG